MITLEQALTRASGQLAAHPDLRPTAVPDAAVLLMHLLAIDRAALIAHPERKLDREQLADYQRLIERRLRFEPIQYILGTQEFFGLSLRVTPAVLIPRPETELLVEAFLGRLRDGQPATPKPLRLADVGTGSGAIAIALAHAIPQAQVMAFDLSPAALALAAENARSHHVTGRIRFLVSDLLEALPPDAEPFDAILSNPPYIPEGDLPTLHPQVREHEPAQALFAGPDGLDLYRRLIPQAAVRLQPGGLLALEFGFGQREALALLLAGWQSVEFLPDLQGIPRIALASKPD
jgi:release factor glutamine methyltransferase